MTFWIRFALIAAGVVLLVGVGKRWGDMACSEKFADMMREAEVARKLDENFIKGVDHRNQSVLSELKRITTVNRVETIRETQKIEYRCPLLPDGERLRLDAIRAANRAASGEPPPPVPADPGDPGSRPRGATPSLFGTDGDLR
jgi:hypothetical protein